MKEIDITTREDAIRQAANYCKCTKRPQVIPSTSNLCFGIAGLVFIDAGMSEPKESVYFPIKDVEMTSLPITDRLDFVGFFDMYGRDSYLDINRNFSMSYLSNVEKEVCACVPFSLMDNSSTVNSLVEHCRENNNKYYKSIIHDISKIAWPNSDPIEPASESIEEKKNKVPLLDDYTVYEVRDRIEFVTLFDKLSFICPEDKDNPNTIKLVSFEKRQLLHIPISLYRKSVTVRTLINAADKKWTL